jgi:hypothetical protein
VKLLRGSEKDFRMIVELNNGQSYVISNKLYNPDKKREDQSRAYSTFVRVLHFHLKDKSKAIFTSGNQPGKTAVQVVFSLILSFAISFATEFMGISLVNPFIQAAMIMAMMGIIILALNIGRWPKHYSPTEIPLELLP